MRRPPGCSAAVQAFGEACQHGLQIRAKLQRRVQGISLEALQPLRDAPNRELLGVEATPHFVPGEGRGHRGAGKRAHAQRRNQEATMAILEIVEVDTPVTCRQAAHGRRDVPVLGLHHAGQKLRQAP